MSASDAATSGAGGAGAGAGAAAATEPVVVGEVQPTKYAPHNWEGDFSEHDIRCLEFFRKYLCERTVSIIDNYEGAVRMLEERGAEMGLECERLNVRVRRMCTIPFVCHRSVPCATDDAQGA